MSRLTLGVDACGRCRAGPVRGKRGLVYVDHGKRCDDRDDGRCGGRGDGDGVSSGIVRWTARQEDELN